MKKVFAILAIVALASCGGSETAAPATDSAAATVAPDSAVSAPDSAAATVAPDSAAAANDTTKKD